MARAAVAGAGFINFFLAKQAYAGEIARIHAEGARYGCSTTGAGVRVLLEFVSANPTGPLHVGHGRQAAYGATLAGLLAAVGFSVEREYYVNDAGRQMDIFALSVWLRYLELCSEELAFPTNGYQGDYVQAIARAMLAQARASSGPPLRLQSGCRRMHPRATRRRISMRSSPARVSFWGAMDFAKCSR